MAMKTIRATGQLNAGMAIHVQCGQQTLTMDQPKNAGGQDLGPTPLEAILAAVAGCFGTIGRFIAHQQKINLRGMRFELEADYDPDGLLGRNSEVRPGFQELRVIVDIDAQTTLLAIELDDWTHNSKARQKADDKKDKALASAGIAIVRFHAERMPSADMLRYELMQVIESY